MGVALLAAPGARGFEVPPAGDELHIQTNGPNAPMSNGDWYTSAEPGGGAGYHYLTFYVACSWPTGTPIHIDLFSPEMNGNPTATGSDEQNGAELDPSEFELYGPGATVGPGFANPAPGTGIPGTNVTYDPIPSGGAAEEWERFATLAAPVSCGRYVIRAEVKGTEADDQNGWRLRVGTDEDSDPNDAPPANSDNPDGLFGTDDEIQAATFQISYQHEDTGTMNCKTIWELVGDVPSVNFHNFDMDDNGRVRYYGPSDAYDPEALTGGTVGTVSGQTVWNNGTTSRGGDTINDPEPGYWRLVSCISANNQYIQEGQTGRQALNQEPLVPIIDVDKDDGITEIARGDSATYTIDIANTSSGPTAGASRNVQLTDDLPDGFTPTSCQWVAPATGTCNITGQQVVADLNGVLVAGDAASVEIDYSVDNDAVGTLTNTALVGYEDSFGNVFPPETAIDSDQTFIQNADLVIDKSHVADFVYGEQGDYTLAVSNTGPDTAVDVEITDVLPAGLTFAGFAAPGWNCGAAAGTVTCTRAGPLPSGGSDSVQITVDVGAAALGGVTNSAAVTALTPDPDTSDNDDDDPTGVIAATASGTVYEDLNASGTIDAPPEPGVSGWTAWVDLNGDSVRDPGEPFDATDANGDYTIAGIVSGTHTVRLESQAGWTCTFPNPCNHPATDFTGAAQVADLDFAVWEGAGITGTLYDDQDADGVLNEPGESPLTGWAVFLDLNANGSLDGGEPSDTTDSNGVYAFTDLAPGSYTVRVEVQSGWNCSSPSTSCFRDVSLTSGQVSTGNDFGLWVPAGIAGAVFEDVDLDASPREAGEPFLSGWTVYLDLNDSGSFDAGEPTDVTDAGGAYSFGGLVPDAYTVRLELQAGWNCAFPAPCQNDVTLLAGDQQTGVDFGVWTTASLSGTLFEDRDKDGAAREAGEPALKNWTVYLDLDDSGGLDSGEPTRTTDALGNYAFTGLDPGTYTIHAVMLASFNCSHPAPCDRVVALASQQNLAGQDFGAWQTPAKKQSSVGATGAGEGGGGTGSGGGGSLPFTGFALIGMLMAGLGLLLAGRGVRPRA